MIEFRVGVLLINTSIRKSIVFMNEYKEKKRMYSVYVVERYEHSHVHLLSSSFCVLFEFVF
jgi:hypothetical protein